MVDNRVEINNELYIINITDFSSININEIESLAKKKNLKIIIEINNLENLGRFNISRIMDVKNIHLSILYTSQTFIIDNIMELSNYTLIKSLDVIDMRVQLNLYTMENITDSIYENNVKIISRLDYIFDDFKIHSINYEILYQANQILRAYKKDENTINQLKNKINSLNNFVNKL